MSDVCAKIPHEVLSHIFSFATSPFHVLSCGLVCKKWHKATLSDTAWETCFLASVKDGKEVKNFSRVASYEWNAKPVVTDFSSKNFPHWRSMLRNNTFKKKEEDRNALIKCKKGIENHNIRNRGPKNIPYRHLVMRGNRLLPIDCKIVLMGNVDVGKTSFLRRYVTGKYSATDIPEIFKSENVLVFHGGETLYVSLWDTEMWDTSFSFSSAFQSTRYWNQPFPGASTEGGEDYSSFRNLTYANADVFLFCFALDKRESLEYVEKKWVPEVRRWAPSPYTFVLCGMRSDTERKISHEEAMGVAKSISAASYVECSAKTGENIDVVMMACLDSAFENLRLIGLNEAARTIASRGHSHYIHRAMERSSKEYESKQVVRGFNLDWKKKFPRSRDDLGRGRAPGSVASLIKSYIAHTLEAPQKPYSYVKPE